VGELSQAAPSHSSNSLAPVHNDLSRNAAVSPAEPRRRAGSSQPSPVSVPVHHKQRHHRRRSHTVKH
jgi:hypothetical protein